MMVEPLLVPFKCRFEMASADGPSCGSQGEFCAFEFPCCRDCKYSLHAISTVKAVEDPMKSNTWRGYVDALCGNTLAERS